MQILTHLDRHTYCFPRLRTDWFLGVFFADLPHSNSTAPPDVRSFSRPSSSRGGVNARKERGGGSGNTGGNYYHHSPAPRQSDNRCSPCTCGLIVRQRRKGGPKLPMSGGRSRHADIMTCLFSSVTAASFFRRQAETIPVAKRTTARSVRVRYTRLAGGKR